MREWLLVSSVLLCTATPSYAVEPKPWREISTANFHFYGNVDETALWQAAANLERLRGALAQISSEEVVQLAVPLHVFVFRDSETFAPYQLRDATSTVEDAGYLVPHLHGIYAALDASAASPTQLMYRQYIQHLLRSRLPQLPTWFRHGLAEVYSTFEVEGQEARLGLGADGVIRPGSAVSLLDSSRDWTADRIVDHPQNAAELGLERWRQYLDQCRKLVHYLVIGSAERRQQTRVYLRRMGAAEAPSAAFRAAYGEDLTILDRELTAYQEAGTRRFLRISLEHEERPFGRVRLLDRFEAFYHLGDLLLHASPQHRSQAVDAFRSALELAPEHGLSWAGLGYAAELDGDWQAAAANYEKAVEHQADEYLVQYLYGESLLRTLGDRRPQDEVQRAILEQARAALERSVELRPDFAQGWARLGFAWGLEAGPSEAGTAALERARELLPGRQDIAMNLLLAYAKKGDRTAAEGIFEDLRRISDDPGAASRAQQVLLQMDYRLANQLIAAGRLDDAVAMLTKIRTHSSDPALADRATSMLSTTTNAQQHNLFAEGYAAANELLEAGDREAAVAALRQLATTARPGLQQEIIGALLDEIGQ